MTTARPRGTSGHLTVEEKQRMQAFFEAKLGNAQIARRMGLDRKLVRKNRYRWLAGNLLAAPKSRSGSDEIVVPQLCLVAGCLDAISEGAGKFCRHHAPKAPECRIPLARLMGARA